MSVHRTNAPVSLLALDLSGTGAPRAWVGNGDSESEAFIMGRLSGLAALADKGGVDLIALDSRFRLGSGRRRDDWLDGALAASRLGRHTQRTTVVASVPLGVTDAGHVASAVTSVHKATAGRAGWQVEGGARPNAARTVDAVIGALASPKTSRRTGSDLGGRRPHVVVDVTEPLDAELAAARADVARIRATSLEEAVSTRTAIRQAAQDWGRTADDIAVIVDVEVVLGADAEGAQARAELIDVLETEGSRASGRLRFVGTATQLADLWQEWVAAGAADGFTVVPASVPTDVLATVTELVPELERRGLRERVVAPAAAGTAATTRSGAPRRSRPRVAVGV